MVGLLSLSILAYWRWLRTKLYYILKVMDYSQVDDENPMESRKKPNQYRRKTEQDY